MQIAPVPKWLHSQFNDCQVGLKAESRNSNNAGLSQVDRAVAIYWVKVFILKHVLKKQGGIHSFSSSEARNPTSEQQSLSLEQDFSARVKQAMC